MTGYEFHPRAATDLDEIWEYIAAENAAAARPRDCGPSPALDNLMSFPHSGHRRLDLTNRPTRFRRVRVYPIAYAPDEKPLWVIAVMHGHLSPRTMAAILRGREETPNSSQGAIAPKSCASIFSAPPFPLLVLNA